MKLKRIFLLYCLSLLLSFCTYGQEKWFSYIADYENGPGSIIVDMSLSENAPRKDQSFVVITGVTFDQCRDGLPEKGQFDQLYEMEDQLSALFPPKKSNPRRDIYL